LPRCLVVIALAFAVGSAACGGGGSNSSRGSTSTPPPQTGLPPAPAVSAPIAVNVIAGTTTPSVDIITGSPASSPVVNAVVLGVGNTATNVGVRVSRSVPVQSVILFGPGLSGNMTVSISGPPNDIVISGQQTIQSKPQNNQPGQPGILFNALLSPSTALGARTVSLQNPNGDITVFAGGLEIVP
jgi:hypothetical protein